VKKYNVKKYIFNYNSQQYFYPKFTIEWNWFIGISNAIIIFFILDFIFDSAIADKSILNFLVILVLSSPFIFFDIDFIHARLKKQYIYITDDFIFIKKLIRKRTFNWSDIGDIGELGRSFIWGAIIRKRKSSLNGFFLLSNAITINFLKYRDLKEYKFMEFLYRKKKNRYIT
jgi:hypothetical protein